MSRIVEIASAEIGNGEEPRGSNAGPHVERYLGTEYKPGRSWCAGFVAWCLEQAEFEAPVQGRARRGARALVRWVAESGRWVLSSQSLRRGADPFAQEIRPGDVICWRRGRIPWQCHVALVADYSPVDGTMTVIEGNCGSRVKATRMSGREWPRRMRGLYGIARPRPVTEIEPKQEACQRKR